MKTAVIYARYSSERQTEQSIEGQIHVCTDFAKRNNILIVDTYIDRAMTGTNDNRKSFQKMLKDSSKKAWDYVIVYKLDRFSRNRYEMAIHKKTLKDNGIKVLSAMENISDTPEGIILESLLEGMAEYYSAELSQKVKRGMKELRLKGNSMGGYLLYGFKKDGKKYVIDEEKAEIVKYIFNEYAKDTSIRQIIAVLEQKGITNNRGKPFSENTVYKMLSNSKYIGVFYCDGEEYTNTYPPIIEKETFNLVQKRISANKYGSKSNKEKYLLRNKLFCGYCGKTITAETGTARNGNVICYYKCFGKKKKNGCQKELIRKEVLEELVIDTIAKTFDSDMINKIADTLLKIYSDRSDANKTLAFLKKEKRETEKAIDNFLIAISKGIVTESTQKMLLDLETKLNNLKEQITIEETALSCQVSREDIIRHFAVAIKKDPAVMINLLIDKIILYDDKIEIYYKSLTNKSPDKRQDFLIYNNEVYYDKTRVVKNLYLTQTNHKKVVLKLLQFIAA